MVWAGDQRKITLLFVYAVLRLDRHVVRFSIGGGGGGGGGGIIGVTVFCIST